MTATQTAEETTMEILKRFASAAVRVHVPECDRYGNPNLMRFFLENQRLPFVTDEIKPWQYRGWLVPYRQMAEAHPLVEPRYTYVLQTLEAGKILDTPPPEISFYNELSREVQPGLKMLNKLLDQIEYTVGTWNAMREFCDWLGFALGVTHTPSKLKFDLQEYLYRTFNLEPLLLYPTDYLGQLLCESNYGKKQGFFPTPMCISDLMARCVGGGGQDYKFAKTEDCAVGTGRLLLAASNFSLRLYGQDIDALCCLITKINLALYAPWSYIPEEYFPADESTVEEKDAPPPMTAPSKVIQPEPSVETSNQSLFERLRHEKENRKRKTHSTVIEEQLTLF